ncbi:acyltransferase family protein [Clostridium sp. VAP51]|uniref:acyltransferase family protein n=1 Tax=Clostridium sp. VAP51 TaxID=2949978 RepID=UPI00338DD671
MDTAICKGIAIILMLMHHLFGFNDRIKNGAEYTSIFSISGENIEFLIAHFGKICVAMFLFLNGFGMYKKWIENKDNINSIIFDRVKALYINYWTIFLIFIPVSFLFVIREFRFSEFFDNFVGYSSSYNPEGWFLKLYIITFPIAVKIISQSSLVTVFRIILISVLASTILPEFKNIQIFNSFFKTTFSRELLDLLYWIPCFLMGCTFAKFDLFSKFQKKCIENKLDNIFVYILFSVIIIYIRKRNANTIDFDYLLVPIFIISSVNIIKILRINKIFEFLGKNSTNIWLMHSYFCYQYFQKLVYYPKNSIIIVIWLILLCIICSILVIYVQDKIKIYYRKKCI